MKPYPQSPPLTDEELKAFLNQASVARLASLNPDGTIHIAPVWFSYENGDILIGTEEVTRKARNVLHDQNVSLLIDTQEPPYKGVLIYGQAKLDHDAALRKRTAIFEQHMPADIAQRVAHGLASQFTLVTIRVKPQRVISYDDAKRRM